MVWSFRESYLCKVCESPWHEGTALYGEDEESVESLLSEALCADVEGATITKRFVITNVADSQEKELIEFFAEGAKKGLFSINNIHMIDEKEL